MGPNYEQQRAEFELVTRFGQSEEWNWLSARLTALRDEVLRAWSKGEHSLSTHERLAGQLKLLGDLLELPDAVTTSLSEELKIERTERASKEAPEPYPMSPVPDEDLDYPNQEQTA